MKQLFMFSLLFVSVFTYRITREVDEDEAPFTAEQVQALLQESIMESVSDHCMNVSGSDEAFKKLTV